MAGLSSGPFFDPDYDPQRTEYSYSSRLGWPETFALDPTGTRTPQHLQPQRDEQQQQQQQQRQQQQHHQRHHNEPRHNMSGVRGRRSTTPLPMNVPLFDPSTLRSHQTFSFPIQTHNNAFSRNPVAALQDLSASNDAQCASFDQAFIQNHLFGDQMGTQANAYAGSMGHQPQDGNGFSPHSHPNMNTGQPAWGMPSQSQAPAPFPLQTEAPSFGIQNYPVEYQASPTDLMTVPEQSSFNQYDASYIPMGSQLDNMQFTLDDIAALSATAAAPGLPDPHAAPALLNSPTGSTSEVGSFPSSDGGWIMIDNPQADSVIFNPGEALHPRTSSNSSYSDQSLTRNRYSFGSFVDVNTHAVGSPNSLHAVGSPSSDSAGEVFLSTSNSGNTNNSPLIKQESQTTSPVLDRATVKTSKIKSSPSRSPEHRLSPPSGRVSPPGRRQSRKHAQKAFKSVIRKQPSPVKSDPEKKVGRRKGPLRPEQRKQACEIRKLGACLRCKYLKKTCDPKEQCDGCQAHHTRLWNIPCVRIDIRDLGNFLKDWKEHFEQTIHIGWAINNIKGHKVEETTLYVTHGFGVVLPVKAREVMVRDDGCFGLDWVEQVEERSVSHTVQTAKYSTGLDGVSAASLSQYLEHHIDTGFDSFVDNYYEGTPFVTEMLKTVHRYYIREGVPIIRKALKMLLAYNLTHHITMLEGIPEEQDFTGRITSANSKFHNKIATPVMINFEVKVAMSKMWKDLQKDVLDDLSPLYQSIYSKEKFKNWPTIFMVLMVLLSVWEEIQFDYHYRINDRQYVQNFCDEMESIPVKVLVGLFSTVSQRLPSFYDWNSAEHSETFRSNNAVCDAMTEVRQHVETYDDYLRGRCDTAFDANDFDSLSNKFTSKLVLRPIA